MFLILVSSTDNYNELKRYSHWGLKWSACVELLHRPCQHIPVVAASAVLHQTQTLHIIRHLASHSFYKYCTNRSHNGWNVICKNVQISTNGDEIMVMYKLNMPYEMNIKYIYIYLLCFFQLAFLDCYWRKRCLWGAADSAGDPGLSWLGQR